MRILVIAHFAGSPEYGMVFGHYYLAREWVKRGHQVTIVSASFAHTRHKQPLARHLVTEQNIDGIRYLWLRVPRYRAHSRLGRVLNIVSFALMCKLLWRRFGCFDAVVCSSHHPLPIFTADRIARESKAPLVFEVRDLWPLTLIELGGASTLNPLIVWMQRAEDFAYARSDRIVSVLPYALEYMKPHGARPDKFVYIPNGVEPLMATEPLPQQHMDRLSALRASGRRLIGYAGRVGLANALDACLLGLQYVSDPSWTLVVLGHGPHCPGLLDLAARKGLADRLLVLSPVSHRQSQEFLRHVDLAYLGLQDKRLFRYGVSSTKLNDYLLAAKVVVCAVPSPPDAVVASGAGIVCPPEDHRAIASAIDKLGQLTTEQLGAMGTAGRSWLLANRRYEDLAAQFLEAMKPEEVMTAVR